MKIFGISQSAFQIETTVKVNSTDVIPYSLEYKVEINDKKFKERIKKIQHFNYVIIKQIKMFDYKLHIIRYSDMQLYLLNESYIPAYIQLNLLDTPARISLRQDEVKSYQKKFEKALNAFLSIQLIEFRSLQRDVL